MKMVLPTPQGFAEAVAFLHAGEVVAYPTETVYGLGADPFSEDAVRRLFTIKERDPKNPVLLIVADMNQLQQVAAKISPVAEKCIRAFWPGPLSLLFPKAPELPGILTGNLDTVCVRCPGSIVARELCRVFGGAITSTSANRSGSPPACCIEDAALPGIALGINGGTLDAQNVSTIFDPVERRVVRPGLISEEEIKSAISK